MPCRNLVPAISKGSSLHDLQRDPANLGGITWTNVPVNTLKAAAAAAALSETTSVTGLCRPRHTGHSPQYRHVRDYLPVCLHTQIYPVQLRPTYAVPSAAVTFTTSHRANARLCTSRSVGRIIMLSAHVTRRTYAKLYNNNSHASAYTSDVTVTVLLLYKCTSTNINENQSKKQYFK